MDLQARRDAMADAETLPDDIALKCPDCGRLTRIPLMRHAVVHAWRKCRGCKMRWFIVSRPLAVSRRGVVVHHVDWTPERLLDAARNLREQD